MNEFTIQIILLVALFAVMYFVLIRPQKKRDKEIAAMRESLKVGDDIVTIGGIFGKVVRIREDRVTIQVGADKARLEIAKWGISSRVNGEPKGKVIEKDEVAKEEETASRPTPKTIKKLGKSESDSEATPEK